MVEIIKNAFKQPELRRKLLYTLMIIIIFRLGANIPVPFLDPQAIKAIFEGGTASALGLLDVMTGGALSQGTMFAMSITPYINASIIMQLLTVALPPLERMQKEGEEGRKKIQQITRYLTIGLALIQGWGYFLILRSSRINAVKLYNNWQDWLVMFVIIAIFTAGASLIMWLGEQINSKGIGNGISMLLFAGIVSRLPFGVNALIQYWNQGTKYYYIVPAIIVLIVLIIAAIVVMHHAERRIPISYAKRVVGRKMYGGQSSFIPIKVNMSGVMPIIFASSFVMLPDLIRRFVDPASLEGASTSFWAQLAETFSPDGAIYGIALFLLIIAFNFFYVSITYNPIQMANDLRKNNGAIPGIRPGQPTQDFISRVLSKIVLMGGLFLGLVAVMPTIVGAVTSTDLSLGGTSILIVVGVALETTRTLESQMVMRHHKGFLE